MKFRLARRGEGADVARLGETALQGQSQGSSTGDLAHAVDEDGGVLSVPWGRAYVLVGDAGDRVRALAYVTPPVRLVESYAERGEAWQKILADRVAEIQLLAVDEEVRGRGHASQLLAVTEESLRQRGCGALLVKVLTADKATAGWYRGRGYTLLGTRDFAVLNVGGQQVPIAARKGEPYLAGVKRIRGDQ